jgi:SP family arabinose:H+ symporter-like MFS transporter
MIEDPKDTKQNGSAWYLAVISIVAALGGFLFGFDTAVVSGTIDPLVAQFSLTANMEGITVATALVGCAVGAAGAGLLSDRFGRKATLIAAAALFLVSAIGSALPPTWSLLLIARFIGGLGVGTASMLSPMYLSEMSPPHQRGRLVALYQLAITIGILIAYFSNAMVLQLANGPFASLAPGIGRWLFVDQFWRAMFLVEAIPAAAFLLLLLPIPESARWLAGQRRDEQARSVLSRIVGRYEPDGEMQQIHAALQQEGASIRELLKPGLRIALLIGIALPFFAQASGINAVMYYGPGILSDAGWKISASLGGQVWIGAVNMIFTFIAIALVDRFGRKPLTYLGTLGLIGSFVVAGVFYVTGIRGTPFLISLLAFVGCFAFSLGPVPWIIISEIFPSRIRGKAMAIGTMTVWITNTVLMFLVPVIRDAFGLAWTFWLFALLVAPCLLLTWLFIPETKGKTLEEVERAWSAATWRNA